MSNVNTFAGFYNVPAQLVGVTTETALLVPATSGVYPGYPSPSLPASSGLSAEFPADVALSMANDGHPFRVRFSGLIKTGASSTATLKLYEMPLAGVGQIGATNGVTTVGAPATSNNVVVSLAASAAIATATVNFVVEAEFIWDSTSLALNGWVTAAQINGVNIVPNGGAAGTMVATTQVTAVAQTGLNFLPSITFGTANAANSWTVREFVIDRS